MTTFIALFVWMERGVHDVINASQCAEDFRSRSQKAGGAFKNVYWMMGQYDGVIVFDAFDEATAAALMMGVCARGNVFNKTLRLLPKTK
jgi:uncharacterized protein with GYD domain